MDSLSHLRKMYTDTEIFEIFMQTIVAGVTAGVFTPFLGHFWQAVKVFKKSPKI